MIAEIIAVIIGIVIVIFLYLWIKSRRSE